MKKIVCLLLVLLMLGGCAEEEEKITVCKVEKEGISEEMTLTSLGDQVLKSVSVMSLPFSMYDIETEKDKQEFASQMLAKFEVSGIEVVDQSTETEFIMEMTIDYTVVSFADLSALGMLDPNEVDVEIVSLEKTLESMNASGYQCE